jgi:hypothetical protein
MMVQKLARAKELEVSDQWRKEKQTEPEGFSGQKALH